MRINWLKCKRANILVSLESKKTEAFFLCSARNRKTLEPSRQWRAYRFSYEYFGLQPKPVSLAHKVFHCFFVICQIYRRFCCDYRTLSPRQCELIVDIFAQVGEILLGVGVWVLWGFLMEFHLDCKFSPGHVFYVQCQREKLKLAYPFSTY